MKKTLTLLAVSALFATSAHAHRVWVETAHTHGGEYLKADLGYGEFPELEPIAKDRLHIFSKPMQLVTEKGKENMIQRGTYNYQYRSNRPVKDGSYLVIAEYQPTFWSKTKQAGNRRASKKCLTQAIANKPECSAKHRQRRTRKRGHRHHHQTGRTKLGNRPAGQSRQHSRRRTLQSPRSVPWRTAAQCHRYRHL